MNEGPLVTVVIPAYNAAAHLAETLQSVRDQTYRNLQVLVVDDGSTDETPEVAAGFLEDPRFELVRQENAGVSAALNAGVARSRGEWVAILGADDIWLADKIERQVSIAAEHPEAGLIFCNAAAFCESGPIGDYYPHFASYPRADLLAHLIEENPFCASTMMMRAEVFGRFGAFEAGLRVSEDYELWIRFALNGVAAAGTDEVLHRQRVRRDGLTCSNRVTMLENQLAMWRRVEPMLTDERLVRALRRSVRTARSDMAIARARLLVGSGRARRSAASFLRAWTFRTSRRWLLGAAASCLVLGRWSRPKGRSLTGWMD